MKRKPGNANLLIGGESNANQEIGVPESAANHPGAAMKRKPGNANLLIGGESNLGTPISLIGSESNLGTPIS